MFTSRTVTRQTQEDESSARDDLDGEFDLEGLRNTCKKIFVIQPLHETIDNHLLNPKLDHPVSDSDI